MIGILELMYHLSNSLKFSSKVTKWTITMVDHTRRIYIEIALNSGLVLRFTQDCYSRVETKPRIKAEHLLIPGSYSDNSPND